MQRILVVDDDRDLAKLLAIGLRLRGYLVEVAENGRDALALLNERRFDVIVLDWNMPIMGGEGFLEEHHRRKSSVLSPPVVVITARYDAERKARELGAVAAVAKPFNINELVRVLASVLDDA